MPAHRSSYSPSRVRRTSRQVRESTLGSHVVRDGSHERKSPAYADEIRRRARLRRFAAVLIAVLIVVAVALVAGFLAFRGSVDAEIALKDSDAGTALSATRAGESHYTLIAVELGAVAQPLETDGPDVIVLARVDPRSKTLSLVNIPSNLQVTSGNGTASIASAAVGGDAALINAVESFAKVSISHIVKVGEEGLTGIVDALDGVEVGIDQVIDDPHAGDVYLPAGARTLNGATALTYLRAENLKLGVQDKLAHQVQFAALLLERLFSSEGNFSTRLESIDSFFQTDCSLADIEDVASWLRGVAAGDIVTCSLPGYIAATVDVSGGSGSRFIGAASDMAAIIAALEEGRAPAATRADEVAAADPSGFTVEVQNGTTIAGAAAATADALAGQGFSVGGVGNAEQPIYEETLVVYKGDEGLPCARAVIEALGIGRAVEGRVYYSFDADVLVIIGSDYLPVS